VPIGPSASDTLPPRARRASLALPKLPLALPRLQLGFLARLELSPEKTWLAAAAFAAGVAVTWFCYDPEPTIDVSEVSVINPEQEGSTPIRTLSVDDLPAVPGEEGSSLAILRTNQLPTVSDDGSERSTSGGVGSGNVANPSASNGSAPPVERRAAAPVQPVQTTQKVHALTPAPAPRAAAKATEARSNCSPPYVFDAQGIQRLKPECMGGSGVIAGPYGAVIASTIAPSSAANGAPSVSQHAAGASSVSPSTSKGAAVTPAKSANAKGNGNASCSPPYYFDGNIRRIKLDCL